MSGPYTLARLLWRPAALLMLWALAMASLGATWNLAGGPADLISGGLYGDEWPDLRLALWRLATLLPAVTGMILSLAARELQHTLFAWTLPGLSGRLLRGKLLAGLLLAVLLASLVARMSGADVASGVFGWALLCFALGGIAFDPVLSKVESRGVPVLLSLLVYRPAYLDQLFASQPVLLGAASAMAAALLLRREFSRGISIRRPLAGVSSMWSTAPRATRQYWSRQSTPEREWNVDLAADSVSGWLRAGYYETYGGARRGWGGIALIQISFASAAAYFTDSPQMVVIMSWVILGTIATQLRAKFLYPLPRTRRARLFFLSTVMETTAVSALAAATVLFLLAVGPRTDAPPEKTLGELASFFAFFAAWAPVGHWGKIREPWTDDGSTSPRRAARFFAFQIVFVILAMTSVAQFQRFAATSASSWVAVGVLAAAIYAVYWSAIRRYYSTHDLVFART